MAPSKSSEPAPSQGTLGSFLNIKEKPKQTTLNTAFRNAAAPKQAQGDLPLASLDPKSRGGPTLSSGAQVENTSDSSMKLKPKRESEGTKSDTKPNFERPGADFERESAATPEPKTGAEPPAKRFKTSPEPSPTILHAAEALAQAHHAKYDPSHDFHHVDRVRRYSMLIAKDLTSQGHPVDLLVVEIAALFHDLLDRKYLPQTDLPPPTALEHLTPFFDPYTASAITKDQIKLVAKVVENVSYSKEVKRIAAGKQTPWHKDCLELHCVMDADKLDAMGAFGTMRCAAYSALVNRPLHILPANPAIESPLYPSGSGSGSATEHFEEKLFKLEGMMRTSKGKELAKKRGETMRIFVDAVQREARECASME